MSLQASEAPAGGKSKKSKKKKDKGRQVLAVEVNFNDGKEEALRSEMTAALEQEEHSMYVIISTTWLYFVARISVINS